MLDAAPMVPLQDAQLPEPGDVAQLRDDAQPEGDVELAQPEAQLGSGAAHLEDDVQPSGDVELAQPEAQLGSDAAQPPGHAAQPEDSAQPEGDVELAQPEAQLGSDAAQPPAHAQLRDDSEQLAGDAQSQGDAQLEGDAAGDEQQQPKQVRKARDMPPVETPLAVARLQPPDVKVQLDSNALGWKSIKAGQGRRVGFGPNCDRDWRVALKMCLSVAWERSSSKQQPTPSDDEVDAVVAEIEAQMMGLPERPTKYTKL